MPNDTQADLMERARDVVEQAFGEANELVAYGKTKQTIEHAFLGALIMHIAAFAKSERETAAAETRRAALSEFRNRMSLRLNNHLIEMKPGYDDSITGFNEAWEILIRAFDESLERLTFASSAPQEETR